MATRWRVLNKRRRRKLRWASMNPYVRAMYCKHPWEETYYGILCRRCDTFYAHGSAPWEQDYDYGDYYDDDEGDGDCWHCGGDGCIDGYEDDPLWFEPGEMERCSSCYGSGRAKDMTIW